jgi:hypothetical protein
MYSAEALCLSGQQIATDQEQFIFGLLDFRNAIYSSQTSETT